jgi:outer membrane protein
MTTIIKMQKLFSVTVLVMAMLFGSNQKAAAQNKFGYFDDKTVLGLMPGIDKVDTLLAVFQQDSLVAEKTSRTAEFYRNDSILKADSVTLVKAHLYEQKKKELIQQYYLLQNWDQYAQQRLQNKQAELLAPFQEKMFAALQAVIKEGGYTYMFKVDILWSAPPGDNLIPAVLKKLGIKIPDQPGQRQQGPTKAPVKAPVKH